MKNNPGINSLGNYFSGLKASIAKKDISLDLSNAFNEITETLIPMYESLDTPNILEGKVLDDTTVLLKGNIKEYSKDVYTTILKLLRTIRDNEDDIHDMVDDIMRDENQKHMMDYRKINILKYVESIAFVSNYVRRWLQAVTAESFATATGNSKFGGVVVKADRMYVTGRGNAIAMAQSTNILMMDTKQFLKAIKRLEGHVFDPEVHESISGTDVRKVDPLSFGLIPTSIHPVYQIGLILNTWWARKHERNKEELARLQLTIAGLKEVRNSNTDENKLATLTKQIDYHTNRANKLLGQIESIEQGE